MKAKRLFRFVTLLAILGVGASLILGRKPAPAARLEAEREVYAVLFASLVSPDEISQINEYTLIDEYTTVGESQTQECTAKGTCLPFVSDDLQQLKKATLADFRENNRQSSALKAYLPSTIDPSLLIVDDQKSYWWRLSFSRIGFDPSLTQALVLVGDCRGDGCFSSAGESIYGVGTVILLEKVNGKWIVRDESQSWHTEKPSP